MISARYAAPVAAMLMLALVPTVIHSYRGVRRDDGLRADAISMMLAGVPSTPTGRKPAWVRNTFESSNWVERTYRVDGVDTTLFVARSYDAKRLYHHPELAVLRGYETAPRGVVRSSQRPEIPLHVVDITRKDRPGVAVYALLSNGQFIHNPVTFQLRTSVELLVKGPRPLTLFLASALAGTAEQVNRSPAARLLLEAIADFERQKPVE